MAEESPLPHEENLRRAVLWLNEQDAYSLDAIQLATQRFGLTPEDQQYLVETFLPDVDE
ncbi:MAG: hypothetical protein U5K43_04285 [Halofilum sp. (in: g-proteobacteria)]|nr:hypothetical protein [Halofilum sp. (in: g-proteobacteria)]